jgi:hypothetical protein
MRAIRFDHLSGSAGTPGKFILSYEQIVGPERIPSRDIRFRTHYLPWSPQRVEIARPDVGTLDHSRFPDLKKLSDRMAQVGDALQKMLHLDRRTAPGAAC